jgi:hypothetical protein
LELENGWDGLMDGIACAEIYMQDLHILFLEVGVVYSTFSSHIIFFSGQTNPFEYFEYHSKPINLIFFKYSFMYSRAEESLHLPSLVLSSSLTL